MARNEIQTMDALRDVTISPTVGVKWGNVDDVLEVLIGYVFVINTTNGWFDENRDFGTDIALLHSEVSEMFEAFRDNDFQSYEDKEPLDKPLGVVSEAADILIRLLDTCHRHNINLTRALFEKLEYNKTRGYKHGGKLV